MAPNNDRLDECAVEVLNLLAERGLSPVDQTTVSTLAFLTTATRVLEDATLTATIDAQRRELLQLLQSAEQFIHTWRPPTAETLAEDRDREH